MTHCFMHVVVYIDQLISVQFKNVNRECKNINIKSQHYKNITKNVYKMNQSRISAFKINKLNCRW